MRAHLLCQNPSSQQQVALVPRVPLAASSLPRRRVKRNLGDSSDPPGFRNWFTGSCIDYNFAHGYTRTIVRALMSFLLSVSPSLMKSEMGSIASVRRLRMSGFGLLEACRDHDSPDCVLLAT